MNWTELLNKEIQQDYYQKNIATFLRKEYAKHECYPHKDNIFKAFYSIPSPEDVKVVIIGQDPYHEPGQANGLAFSVSHDCKNPPSLQNIIKEMENEFGQEYKGDGDLTYLANQGVLLLNATLTVRRGEANSHAECGWQTFTDNIIQYLGSLDKPIVFMLWGKFAQNKSKLITNKNALVLKAPHPSPYSASRGFFGCNHFVQCNQYLLSNGIEPINWLESVKPVETEENKEIIETVQTPVTPVQNDVIHGTVIPIATPVTEYVVEENYIGGYYVP